MVFKKALPLLVIAPVCPSTLTLVRGASRTIFTRVIWLQVGRTHTINLCEVDDVLIHIVAEKDHYIVDQSKAVVQLWSENDLKTSFSFAICLEIIHINASLKSGSLRTFSALSSLGPFNIYLSELEKVLAAVKSTNAENIQLEVYAKRFVGGKFFFLYASFWRFYATSSGLLSFSLKYFQQLFRIKGRPTQRK